MISARRPTGSPFMYLPCASGWNVELRCRYGHGSASKISWLAL